jgi:hypothetical protein
MFVHLQHRCLSGPQAALRVLFMRAFAHLFEAKPSGLNTLNILRNNPHMIELQQAINQAVIDDFAAAKEAVRVRAGGDTAHLVTQTALTTKLFVGSRLSWPI